jgi:hypothetical protein
MTDDRVESADDIDDDDLRQFYSKALDVWQPMGQLGDNEQRQPLIVPGTWESNARNWYRYSDDSSKLEDPDADCVGRPWSVIADDDDIVDAILDHDYRLPHLTINYQTRGLDEWQPKNDDGWIDGRPLPDYADVDCMALFADVDFSSDAKTRPVDDDTREQVEDDLETWRDAFAGAVGGDRDAVAMLDSVGGTYILLRPAVTLAIGRLADLRLNDSQAQLLMRELANKWKQFTIEVQEEIDEDGGQWDAFNLDGKTNKNRLYKAPLAIHKELPGVVTPIDPADPTFELTHFDDVNAGLIWEVEQWADRFTSVPDEASDWAAELVATLWDCEPDDWKDTLVDWAKEADQAAAEATANAVDEFDPDDVDIGTLAGSVDFVTDRTDMWDAVNACNCETVASKLGIISDSEQAKRDDVTRIEVTWRKSDSGDSAMVNAEQFTDMDGMNGLGGPADLVAFTKFGSSDEKPDSWRQDPDKIATVLQWFWAESCFDVPVYVPEAGEKYTDSDGKTQKRDQTPNWAIRRVAELLDIAPDAAIDDRSDNIVVPTLYNRILAVLDDAGVDHGRQYRAAPADVDGRDASAVKLNINVSDIIAGSDADIPDDGFWAGAGISSSSADNQSTWTKKYGIKDRDSVELGGIGKHEVAVPGIDLKWIEQTNRRAGWAWERTVYDEDGNSHTTIDYILNADIELLSRLDYDDGQDIRTEWKLRVNPTTNEPQREITVTPAAFNSSREFRDEIVGKTESVVFNHCGKGSKAVNELKRMLNAQDAPRRTAHGKISLVEDDNAAYLVTPNGTIGADGWIDDRDAPHIFAGRVEGVQSEWQADPELIDAIDDDLAAHVAELLPRIRDDSDRWLPMLGYVFASTFRPVLFDQPASQVNTWNLLHVSGKSGSGKSAIAKTLWGAIGMNPQSTTGAEKTRHAQVHMFSATNGLPVMMDEYNPTNWANWKADAFHEHLKKSTDAQSIEKGNPDQSLEEYRFETSPVILGEQTLPDDMPALSRRAIELQVTKSSTSRGSETQQRFTKLQGLSDDDHGLGLHHHGIAWWSWVCDSVRNPLEVVNDWHEADEWMRSHLSERGININEKMDRTMYQQGLQTVVFGIRRWREFASDIGADSELLPDDEDIIDALEYLIEAKTGDFAQSVDNESAFLEVLGDAASKTNDLGPDDGIEQEYVCRDQHYRLVKLHSEDPTQLRIHLKSCLSEVSRYLRDYGIDVDLYEKSDYMGWLRAAAEDPDSFVNSPSIATSIGDRRLRCVSVNFGELCDELDVHRHDFIPSGIDESKSNESGSSDDDDDGSDDSWDADMKPIGEIEPKNQLTASTTGSVEIEQYDGLNGSTDRPDLQIHITDDTGRAKLVFWEEDHIPTKIIEDGVIEPDALLVRNANPQPGYDDDDDDELVYDTDRTSVDAAQIGAGAIPSADTGPNDELPTTDVGTTAEHADDEGTAESNPSNERIDDRITQETTKLQTGEGADRDAVAKAVASELNLKAERVSERIDQLLANDRGIYRTTTDCLKPK